jgi:hypothetical protein
MPAIAASIGAKSGPSRRASRPKSRLMLSTNAGMASARPAIMRRRRSAISASRAACSTSTASLEATAAPAVGTS